MTFNVRDVATAGGSTSLSITIPATTVVGDALLLYYEGSSTITGAPSGWTTIVSGTQHLLMKSAVSADIGATFNLSTSVAPLSAAVVTMDGWVPFWGSDTFASTTGSSLANQSTRVGDILLAIGNRRAGNVTLTFSSTTSGVTFTHDAQLTTNADASVAIGHAYPNTSTTNVSVTKSPTGGSVIYVVVPLGTVLTSAAAGGAATVTLPPALVAAAGGAATVTLPPALVAAAGGAATVTLPPALVAAAGSSATILVHIFIASATATVTGLAPATGAAVGGSLPPIVGVTARVSVNADAPAASFDGGDITIVGKTAEITGDPHAGILTVAGGALGDNFSYPFVAAGSGATVTVITNAYTVETDEPAPVWDLPLVAGQPGTVLVKTAWIRYTPNANGTLTITGATGAADKYQIELFEGDALDNLVRAAVTNNLQMDPDTSAEIPPEIEYVVGTSTPVYIRFWPTGDITNLTVNLTLALAADSSQQGTLFLTTATPTFSTSPGVIRADVVGGTPDGDLVFDLQGTTASYANPPGVGLGNAVATYTADTSGNLYGASIALPTVSAGTYTLRVSDAGTGLTDSLTIQVETNPIVPPATIGPDDPIGSVSHGTTVKYWVLKDPAPSGLATYQFTINPTTMTSPHAPRNVTIEHTVAPDGHDLIWEGAYKANEWHFQGIVLAQADYESIVAFAELNRRFWIVDHRDRAWIASIESIGWTKHRALANDWAWDYDITALIYDGPTSI